MYGDDLRIQEFAEELDGFKEELLLIECEEELLELINALVQSGCDLLNSVCSLQKRTVN